MRVLVCSFILDGLAVQEAAWIPDWGPDPAWDGTADEFVGACDGDGVLRLTLAQPVSDNRPSALSLIVPFLLLARSL